MPAIKKSRNSIWRVWCGPLSVGKKPKKKVGITVAVSVRLDKLPGVSEKDIIDTVSNMLRKHVVAYDPE